MGRRVERFHDRIGSIRAAVYVTIAAWDFVLSAGVTVLVAVLTEDVQLRDAGVAALGVAAGIGITIVVAVLGAMTLLTTFMDRAYRRVLETTRGGIEAALVPFQIVAVLGGATALVAGVGALAWDAISSDVQPLVILLTIFLFVWALAGTVHMVFQIVWHARTRARLLEASDDARKALRERRQRSASSVHR